MLTTPREPVLQKLLGLPLALEIRDSGGGFHVLALLKEEVESGTEEFERVNALRARLTKILCGDPAPDHAAALLRRPGTHNSKYGEPGECHVVRAGKPVDVTEVETLAELYEQPLFEFKPKANGHVPPSPPAGENTDAGPVDAGSRLAAMTFEGPGDSSIHRTQLSCTAPLLCRGRTVECAVDEVLDATRRAVTGNPECANWDWAEERWTIEKMCFDFVNKNRELCEVLPDKLRESWRERQDRAASTSRSCGAATPINGASPVANRATEEAAYRQQSCRSRQQSGRSPRARPKAQAQGPCGAGGARENPRHAVQGFRRGHAAAAGVSLRQALPARPGDGDDRLRRRRQIDRGHRRGPSYWPPAAACSVSRRRSGAASGCTMPTMTATRSGDVSLPAAGCTTCR